MRRPAIPDPKAQSETALQMQVVKFLRWAWPADLLFYHVPNGGKREQKTRTGKDGKTVRYSPEAGKLKAMGVRPGVGDLAFHLPKGRIGYIELKVGANDLEPDQIDFRDDCLAHGHGYAVARSLQDVEHILAGWLALYGRKLRASTVTRAA